MLSFSFLRGAPPRAALGAALCSGARKSARPCALLRFARKAWSAGLRPAPLRSASAQVGLRCLGFCLLLLGFSVPSFGQEQMQRYLVEGEEPILYFETEIGKYCLVSRALDKSYLVFRYGTEEVLEFQFPNTQQPPWPQFAFSYYSEEDQGLNIQYLQFDNKEHKYVVYDELLPSGQGRRVGFQVLALDGSGRTFVRANAATVQGSLFELRKEQLLQTNESLFFEGSLSN